VRAGGRPAAAALLVLLLAAACGGSAPAPGLGAAGCVNPRAAHRAWVVVQHGSGQVVQRCVGFDADRIDADRLMRQSGIEYRTETYAGVGRAVCQLDDEPDRYTECVPADRPAWVGLLAARGGRWQQARTGYASIQLGDGDALGWQYRDELSAPPPPPLPEHR
jgi:hypothetical protein